MTLMTMKLPEMQMVARGTNGQRTVLQIFINDQHIGGSDNLYRLERAGKLDELLRRTEMRL